MRTAFAILVAGAALAAAPALHEAQPVVETDSLAFDVDDPAIWINSADPTSSRIVGTVKSPKPNGALAVFSLNGKLLETIGGLDRPNNVDILGDICVTTERLARLLRIYRVSAQKPHLRLIGTIPAFAGEKDEAGAPMGIALYRRPWDKEYFAIVSRKTGPRQGYLWQYRIRIAGDYASGERVRQFGDFSGEGEIEAVAVDQDRELVYYSDEDCCIRVYRANPDAADANREIARFGETGFRGNREGIAVAGRYVIVADQLDPRSEYHVYRRSDRREITIWRGQAQSTDGLDAVARPLGPRFPKGIWVAMNDRGRNFQIYALP